jgi:hypothetical protein
MQTGATLVPIRSRADLMQREAQRRMVMDCIQLSMVVATWQQRVCAALKEEMLPHLFNESSCE